MPLSQHNEITFAVLLFNIFWTAGTTVVGIVVKLINWLRGEGKSAESIVAAANINQVDKAVAISKIRWANGTIYGLAAALLLSAGVTCWLYYYTRPPDRVALTLTSPSVTFLDVSQDAWAESNPVFRPIVEKLVKEGEGQEKRGDSKDWRLFKIESKPFGDLTNGHPSNKTRLRITYSSDEYLIALYPFIVRTFDDGKFYAAIVIADSGKGHVDLDIPPSETHDSLLIVGRVSGLGAKVPSSLDHLFKVEVHQ